MIETGVGPGLEEVGHVLKALFAAATGGRRFASGDVCKIEEKPDVAFSVRRRHGEQLSLIPQLLRQQQIETAEARELDLTGPMAIEAKAAPSRRPDHLRVGGVALAPAPGAFRAQYGFSGREGGGYSQGG